MDVANRYASTVMISTVLRTTEVRCSGVLISPRGVLTSASCLCEPARRPGSSASCIERAVATTVIYGEILNKEFPEDTAQMRFHSYEGTVRPHPTADLAVIVLDEAVKDVAPETLLEQGEFQAQEPLIMAGYASSGTPQAAGGIYGIRYFRKNTVTRVPPEEPGTVLYEQPGAALYDGYAGGPCFREDSQRRWLAGVAKAGRGQDLSFTSVPFFREWVQAQLR